MADPRCEERREASGSVESGQFCYHRNRYVLHFVARFDRPFATQGTWQGQTLASGATSADGTFSGLPRIALGVDQEGMAVHNVFVGLEYLQ